MDVDKTCSKDIQWYILKFLKVSKNWPSAKNFFFSVTLAIFYLHSSVTGRTRISDAALQHRERTFRSPETSLYSAALLFSWDISWLVFAVRDVTDHLPRDRCLPSRLAFLVFLSLPAHRNRVVVIWISEQFSVFQQKKKEKTFSHFTAGFSIWSLGPSWSLKVKSTSVGLNGDKHIRVTYCVGEMSNVLLTWQSNEQHWKTKKNN